jgi:hypothetical protein
VVLVTYALALVLPQVATLGVNSRLAGCFRPRHYGSQLVAGLNYMQFLQKNVLRECRDEDLFLVRRAG